VKITTISDQVVISYFYTAPHQCDFGQTTFNYGYTYSLLIYIFTVTESGGFNFIEMKPLNNLAGCRLFYPVALIVYRFERFKKMQALKL
jgi:hypothetical protein